MANNSDYTVDPAFKWALKLPAINISNRKTTALIKLFSRLSFALTRVPRTLQMTRHKLTMTDGQKIPLQLYRPADNTSELPCLMYMHGGGFFLPAMAAHKKMICRYALQANCAVLFVDYSLAPKQPFPAAHNEGCEAYRWLIKNAQTLSVDSRRIALGGDSAGGCLAAGISQQISDELGPGAICGQMLVYPVTDHRSSSPSAQEFTDSPVWNRSSNLAMWKVYAPGETPPKYAAPLHTENLSELPTCYIETAEFDPLRDEAIEYAQKMQQQGVSVELNETTGTIHGYDVQNSSIATTSFARRIAALKNYFDTAKL